MYKIIAIEREYSSGGNEIGEKLAKALGYKLLDHNVLLEAAKRLNIPPIYVEDLEETAPGSAIFNLSQLAVGGKSRKSSKPLSEQLYLTEKEILEENVKENNCVIVGRCASDIFSKSEACLKVFIHADKDFRIKRTMNIKKMSESDAENELKRCDKRRNDFYYTHTNKEWGNPKDFEIVLDSGVLGIAKCIDILKSVSQ